MHLVILILCALILNDTLRTSNAFAWVGWSSKVIRRIPLNSKSFKSSYNQDEAIKLPEDAKKILYTGDWNYWYREKGMQTSSDDVLVAFLAALWYYKLPSSVSVSEGSSILRHKTNQSGIMGIEETWINSLQYLFENIEERLPLVIPISTVNQVLIGNSDDISRLTKLLVKAPVGLYVDLGCGVGSSLFLVSQILRPVISLGVEVQTQSALLATRSALAISTTADAPCLAIINTDIRQLCPDIEPNMSIKNTNVDLSNLLRISKNANYSYDYLTESAMKLSLSAGLCGKCDLLTANPPYLPLTDTTRSVPLDSQRRSARFEYHGGIEEYMQVVRQLLSPGNVDEHSGRCVLSFWAKDAARVHAAVNATGLRVRVRVDVLGGPHPSSSNVSVVDTRIKSNDIIRTSERTNTTTLPYLSIFEIIHPTNLNQSYSIEDCAVLTLDLRFRLGKEATSIHYKVIQKWLKMHPRPLKQSKSLS